MRKKTQFWKRQREKVFEKNFLLNPFQKLSIHEKSFWNVWKPFFSKKSANKGFFLVLEGIDGAGTTTQVNAIYNWLKSQKIPCLKTREPSQGVIGRHIKKLLKEKNINPATLALLFASDRLDHLANTVFPALQKGMWVVSDRYRLSSLAYQSLDCDLEWVREINRYAPPPHLTILLDLPIDVALERISKRGEKREIFEQKNKLKKIRRNYLE
jgi:dTMP kinase